MVVKRIIANIAAPDVKAAQGFYGDILGLDLVMDHGWIVTFAAHDRGATTSEHRDARRIRNPRPGFVD